MTTEKGRIDEPTCCERCDRWGGLNPETIVSTETFDVLLSMLEPLEKADLCAHPKQACPGEFCSCGCPKCRPEKAENNEVPK